MQRKGSQLPVPGKGSPLDHPTMMEMKKERKKAGIYLCEKKKKRRRN